MNPVGNVNRWFTQRLDTNGDGTGTTNANGDYSGTQGEFFVLPPAGIVYRIRRLLVCIEDANGFRAEKYGSLAGALTNGIQMEVHDGSTQIIDFLAGATVKTNAAWGAYSFDVELKTWGAGDEILLVRWTFGRAGVPIRLVGDSTQRLRVLLNDDLTGLIAHLLTVQGYIEELFS